MNITSLLEAGALIVAALITAFIIPWIKSRTTEGQQAQINAWIKTAVVAAEQIFAGAGRGEEKKQYVLNFLAGHGITLEEERVNAIIEAAVYSMKNGVIPTE